MSRPLTMSSTFLPPPTYGVLKSLLEYPMKLPLHHEEVYDKEKKLEEEKNVPQSAFLGPSTTTRAKPVSSAATAAAAAADPVSVMDLSNRVSTSIHTSMVPQPCLQSPTRTVLPSSRNTPSPVDPESIQVLMSYEPDPTDLALSSVPGQEAFDPRKCRFSEDELKPKPIIKKARKVFIPDDIKDEKYWARRRKNNMAAKRSRDARRLKENQIAIRAGFLEKENSALRQEVADLRKELGRCKNILAKYEAQHGPL
ncbi:hypothetical protein PHYPO_G00036730 [Pangasianodon hypophthalmus]|uniref:BZIP domain-containing protein n=1 Tax=Pangasianodon hypophthalmus TaxID=310915 RepID=A0A5N5ML70_PANHP|nr:hypothetical protein PHYPO_G00036730 [Pangasianodon hypophthalmus]